MKKIFALPLVISLSIFCSCQKQQTDAERQAEIDRQVQQRLDAEHQAQEKEQLVQRQGELDAREKALADKEAAAAKNRERETRSTSTRTEQRRPRSDEGQPTGSYNIFYTKLEPYGDWRETSDYGYVWQPRQAEQSRSWRPYNEGRWVYTDAGWTWVSEEPFGWATYHYGRWTRLRNVGWVWVPGDEWAPAWVSWRKGDEYVGWAPLPPEARFDRRTGIHNWSDSYYDIGPEQYCFVETRQFGTPRAQRTVVPTERNVTIVNQTTNVTNITYNNTTVVNQGPSYDEIRTRSQQPVERLRLEREINVNVNVGEARPVVRGEAIIIPAPLIARGEAAERPRKVKETIANVVVERGWEAIADHQAAEKVRAKMKSESTPPPDAPSKTFVKPAPAAAETNIAPSPASAATATPSPTSTSISAPVATSPVEAPTSTPLPTPQRGRFPAKLTETPESSATSAPTSMPFRRNPPTAAPSAMATLTPSPLQSATPTAPPARERPFSTSTLSPSATASPTAASTGAPEGTREEKRGERRRLLRIEDRAKAQEPQPRRAAPMTSPTSPTPTATSPAALSATAISSSPAEKLTKGEKKKQNRERKEAAEAGESVAPSPSAPPQ